MVGNTFCIGWALGQHILHWVVTWATHGPSCWAAFAAQVPEWDRYVGQVPTQRFFGGVPGGSRGGPGEVPGGLRARSWGGGRGKILRQNFHRISMAVSTADPRQIDGISTPAREHFSGGSSFRELTGASQGNPRRVARNAEKRIPYWKMSDLRSARLGLVSLVGLAGWFG